MVPMVAMSAAAACGPMPGREVRILPSRQCSTTWIISVSNCCRCSAMSFNSVMSCFCSKTRPRTRAGSFVPILWPARRCSSRSLASETLQVRPLASRNSQKLAAASAAGVGKRERNARAVGRFGSRKRRVNSGKSRQLVFALGALGDEFIVMLDHPTQLCCGLGGRDESADGLQGITDLDAFLQLVVQEVGKTQRIAFVRFE